jgi:hypothetical protein
MNPSPINTTNIQNFGFRSVFKMAEKAILLDIDGMTSFIGSGADEVLGIVFKITDPSSVVIHEGSFSSPDIIPSDSSTFSVSIPNLMFAFGVWDIEGTIKEADGTEYTVNVIKNICQPKGFDKGVIKGDFSVDVNCNAGTIKVSELTNLSYNEKKPTSISKLGTLFYPQGTLSNLSFTTTPFLVSGPASVYSGDYTIQNNTTATYELGDGVVVELKYFTRKQFSVNCSSTLVNILCCVQEQVNAYKAAPNSDKGKLAKSLIDKISGTLFDVIIKDRVGIPYDAEIEYIRNVLSCDCNCGSQVVEASPAQLGASGSVVLLPGCGIDIESETSGNTTTFTINGQTVSLNKTDLAFDLVYAANECGGIYNIGFNYPILSLNILNEIKGSDNLAALLNSIISKTENSLGSINGRCIADLSQCDYFFTEKLVSTGTQNLVSIVIAGVERVAPSNLSLADALAVRNWLNSLDLGSFTTAVNNVNSTITIASASNPNKISTIKINTNGTNIIKTVTSNCGSLEDLLQAIIDYVCAINTLQIKLDKDYAVPAFDASGNLSPVTVPANSALSSLIDQVLKSQTALASLVGPNVLSCTAVQKIFAPNTLSVIQSDDVIYGTKQGSCMAWSQKELAATMLKTIGNYNDLKNALCELVSTCGVAVCEPPENVSAVLSSGVTCAPITNITGSAQ